MRLRVLIVEDSEDDAELLLRELRRGGYDLQFERVDNGRAMSAALERPEWDLVISDYSMPGFSAPAALSLVQEKGLDLPFIILSGTVGEETAVAALKAGAHDFITKDRLVRLLPAIQRELREAKIRTEQKRMREQLVMSERMATAGMLAAGVAHEINNPLAVVVANLDFINQLLFRPDQHMKLAGAEGRGDREGAPVFAFTEYLKQAEEPLRDAKEALERIRNIVRDVKVFSRSQEDYRGPVDIRRVIESSVRMAHAEIRHRARLVTKYGDVPPVDANEGRLGQVLLNLIVNAAQAIPEGHANDNEILVSTRTDRTDRVVVEIRDTGTGIPKENLDRIFDPFFTTKPIGVGTGLGLAICRRIVMDLGGEIAVDSIVGKGTLFRVLLPTATGSVRPASPLSIPAPAPRRARVLLIDDEEAVGRAIQRNLSPHHDVVTAKSGREALERLAAGERFDVILSDLMMPEITGMDLHDKLAREDPTHAARMIFITGGAFTPTAHDFLGRITNPRIEKPFELSNLLATIAEMLRQ